MDTKIELQPSSQEEQTMQEYSLTIDGVIEVPINANPKAFFDGLLDKIVEFVEEHHGFAALGMSYQEYKEEDDEAAHGDEAT